VPIKILVVEDDLRTRRMINLVLERDRMLRYRQLEVYSAADGEEGLDLFQRHRPDVVLTDLLMPKMDGFQLVEAIRRIAGDETRILVMSAVIRDQLVLRKLERDYDVDVQMKPFSPRVLAVRVRKLLPRRREEEPTAVPQETASEAVAEFDRKNRVVGICDATRSSGWCCGASDVRAGGPSGGDGHSCESFQ
jgi:DNA-binding response OmpR family regulator